MSSVRLILTGFNREAFEKMHDYLYDNEEENLGSGRPRLINNRDELGLILIPRSMRFATYDDQTIHIVFHVLDGEGMR